MPKKLLPLILIFNTIIILSCSNTDNPIETSGQGESPVLVPLAIGNSWTYRITTFYTPQNIDRIDTVTFYIRKDTIAYARIWSLIGRPYTNQDIYIIRDVEGCYNDPSSYHTTYFDGRYSTYRYPGKVGDRWSMGTIIAIDSSINTPLGVLSCYVYEWRYQNIPILDIYAPGIGLVHEETLGMRSYSVGPFIIQTKDLISSNIYPRP
jgi:hypothetical protein